jgi:hypothetical protein
MHNQRPATVYLAILLILATVFVVVNYNPDIQTSTTMTRHR